MVLRGKAAKKCETAREQYEITNIPIYAAELTVASSMRVCGASVLVLCWIAIIVLVIIRCWAFHPIQCSSRTVTQLYVVQGILLGLNSCCYPTVLFFSVSTGSCSMKEPLQRERVSSTDQKNAKMSPLSYSPCEPKQGSGTEHSHLHHAEGELPER